MQLEGTADRKPQSLGEGDDSWMGAAQVPGVSSGDHPLGGLGRASDGLRGPPKDPGDLRAVTISHLVALDSTRAALVNGAY